MTLPSANGTPEDVDEAYESGFEALTEERCSSTEEENKPQKAERFRRRSKLSSHCQLYKDVGRVRNDSFVTETVVMDAGVGFK